MKGSEGARYTTNSPLPFYLNSIQVIESYLNWISAPHTSTHTISYIIQLYLSYLILFFLFSLADKLIDSKRKGNRAKFVNHGLPSNCTPRLMMVRNAHLTSSNIILYCTYTIISYLVWFYYALICFVSIVFWFIILHPCKEVLFSSYSHFYSLVILYSFKCKQVHVYTRHFYS